MLDVDRAVVFFFFIVVHFIIGSSPFELSVAYNFLFATSCVCYLKKKAIWKLAKMLKVGKWYRIGISKERHPDFPQITIIEEIEDSCEKLPCALCMGAVKVLGWKCPLCIRNYEHVFKEIRRDNGSSRI
jgi:hypothetical protein